MRQFVLVLGLILSSSFLHPEAHAQHTRRTNPNTIAVEGLGRGVLYSVQFDRVVSDDLSAGFGFGTVGATIGTSQPLIPFYMIYYLNRDARSVFVTAGASWLVNGAAAGGQVSSLGSMTFPASGVIPNFGLGYESRSDSGFLFRVAAYGLITTTFNPWFGFTFGYSF